MAKRRTTYKVQRLVDLGSGEEALPIYETDNKAHYHEYMDELATERGADCIVKMNSRTASVKY